MKLICIKCPKGCELTIDKDNISGYTCPRGLDYAKEELDCPKRIVTALAKVKGGLVVPVKTDKEVPKDKIFDLLEEISKLSLKKTKIGDIVIKNCLGSGANIVVTGEIYKNDN